VLCDLHFWSVLSLLCTELNLTGHEGTTGTPKGVDVTHRNVTNVVCHAPGNLGMICGSRVGQVLSISFDMGEHKRNAMMKAFTDIARCLGNPGEPLQRRNLDSERV
jgi:acyl-CoA synthetase (AMP-forming)/AMP-acid ligase II